MRRPGVMSTAWQLHDPAGRFRVAHHAIFLNLKRKPQRQLSDASIHGRATDDAERG
jgi:hypothetical protein